MSERPILFSAPMVRAILADTKTQTRRMLRPQPQGHHWELLPGYELKRTGPLAVVGAGGDGHPRMGVRFHHTIPQNSQWDSEPWAICPYGQPGDRLWVRESFWGCDMPGFGDQPCVVYADEWHGKEYRPAEARPWARKFGHIPGIHMPRDASRITLEVTGVRVERLQEISEADARAEGARECDPVSGREVLLAGPSQRGSYALHYRDIWEQINGAGSWAANPYVWVVEFRRAQSKGADKEGA